MEKLLALLICFGAISIILNFMLLFAMEIHITSKIAKSIFIVFFLFFGLPFLFILTMYNFFYVWPEENFASTKNPES